jgi:membrane-associated protease RseP (regulator of RpoE activity)
MHGFLVFEEFGSAPRRVLGRAFGVEWSTSPSGWLTLPAFGSLGLIAGLLWWDGPLAERVGVGVLAGLVVLSIQILHELGHVVSARLAGGPMREVRFVAVRPLTLYHDAVEPPSRVHLGRAVGGPAMNLLLGLVALPLWGAADPGIGAFLLGMFALISLAFGLVSLLPIPSVDGEVIWRELRRR